MTRTLIVALIAGAVLAVGLWYGAHRAPVISPAPRPVPPVAADRAPGRVVPNKSWDDVFQSLDAQWNAEGKTRVQAVSPTAPTPKTLQPSK